METKELIAALRRVATDRHCCLGCGYEHNCSIHGCAVIRLAIERLEDQDTAAGELAALQAQLRRANEDQRQREVRLLEWQRVMYRKFTHGREMEGE